MEYRVYSDPDSPRTISTEPEQMPAIVYTPPRFPGGGPDCIWDNGPTIRTGSCYTCILCGSTTSCG